MPPCPWAGKAGTPKKAVNHAGEDKRLLKSEVLPWGRRVSNPRPTAAQLPRSRLESLLQKMKPTEIVMCLNTRRRDSRNWWWLIQMEQCTEKDIFLTLVETRSHAEQENHQNIPWLGCSEYLYRVNSDCWWKRNSFGAWGTGVRRSLFLITRLVGLFNPLDCVHL